LRKSTEQLMAAANDVLNEESEGVCESGTEYKEREWLEKGLTKCRIRRCMESFLERLMSWRVRGRTSGLRVDM